MNSSKNQTFCFEKKKFYAVEEDEEGYLFVRRYKVTWKY
jgi:hypothetical protein